MESLLQQLRGQSQSNKSDETHSSPGTGHFQHQHQPKQQYQQQADYSARYDDHQSHGAPGTEYETDDIMPPAPTPPVNNMPPEVLAYMSSSGGNSIGASRVPPNSDHASNLLNLLKFQNPSSRQDVQPIMSSSTYQPRIVAPAPVGQDPSGLLAAMMSGAHEEQKDTPPNYTHPNSIPPSSAAEAQSILLGLLNRPKPAQTDQPQQQQHLASESAKSSKSISLTPQSTNESNADYSRDQQYQTLPHSHSFNTTSPTHSRLSDGYSYQHHPTADTQYQNQGTETSSHDSVPYHQQHSASISISSSTHNLNPFADAAQSSPINKTPKSSITPAAPLSLQSHPSPVQVLMKPSNTASPRTGALEIGSCSERSLVASPANTRSDLSVSKNIGAQEPVPENTEAYEKPSQIQNMKQPKNGSIEVVGLDSGSNHFLEASMPENKGTVAEAVSELAPKLDREVQEALASRVEEDQADRVDIKSQPDIPEEEIDEPPKHEISNEANRKLAKEPTDDTGDQGSVVESWENAEGDATADDIVVIEDEPSGIPVYNFPMRPWIGLRLIQNEGITRPNFRDDSVHDITRLKKEFDQIDRNLATASESHIIYGMSRNGGLRVIRQDDGSDVKLFTDTQDRIFNVSVSVSPASGPLVREAIIGTGISGTVYWTMIKTGDEDHIGDMHPEQYGFALPPINSQEGDAPGGVLKTRARPSSMHPDFFAIGRGKTIHMIWPSLIMQGRLFKPGPDRTVDVDQLLQKCSLKINTGKAGKDFTFSADDTTIVTLDKAGKVKFWDIRQLTEPLLDSDEPALPRNSDFELRDPILSLNTTGDGEKPWPTSVLLVDKPKPYQRRTAQRYMIVGTKQNHSFQLWDLTLRKVVQEINLPHGKDSDAACSIMYHATTGMIIIGHPTRNSVYFLHLSAPKYNLKISQVDYMLKLATPDSVIPMPDCTAVLSGYREINFSNSGTLRSLDLLPTPATTEDHEEPVLFELYAMHSKGVSCIHVRQRDLGWTTDNRVKNPKNAVEEHVVAISKITSPSQGLSGSESTAIVETGNTQIPIRVIQRRDVEDTPSVFPTAPLPSRRGAGPDAPSAVTTSKTSVGQADHPLGTNHLTTEKPEKVKGKRNKKGLSDEKSNNSPRPGNKENKNSAASQPTTSLVSLEQLDAVSNKMEAAFSLRLSDLSVQLGSIHDRLDVSLDARERAFDQRSREILKMVSQQLNTNTQALLTDLVKAEFDRRVVPVISDRTTRLITEHLNGRLNSQVSQAVQQEMAKAVPEAVSRAIKDPDLTSYIAKVTSQSISSTIADQVQKELSSHVFPTFKSMTDSAIQQAQNEFKQKLKQTVEHVDYTMRSESSKVDHLVGMVQSLQEIVKTMATTQSQFQAEILKLQQRQAVASPLQNGPPVPRSSYPPKAPQRSSLDPAIESTINDVAAMMRDQNYEGALIRWLQSTTWLNEVYEHYFSNVGPEFLTQVTPLVQLSVATTVSENLSRGGKLSERIIWLETLLQSFTAHLNNNLVSPSHFEKSHVANSCFRNILPINLASFLFYRMNKCAILLQRSWVWSCLGSKGSSVISHVRHRRTRCSRLCRG